MRDPFFGFNIALSGLYTAQCNLDVVNHNVSNITTPGYSKQVAVQTASEPMSLYDGTGMIGTGSQIVSINRVRDEYLDLRYWNENVSLGEWDIKNTQLTGLQTMVNSLSNSGFSKISEDFFNSLQELAKDPSSPSLRSLVREDGVTFTKYFNNLATQLQQSQAELNNEISLEVNKINSLGVQIQELNEQIYTSGIDGNVANDLIDQRTVLIDQLSRLADINVSKNGVQQSSNETSSEQLIITIGGESLIDGQNNLNQIEMNARTTKLNPDEDIDGLYQLSWRMVVYKLMAGN